LRLLSRIFRDNACAWIGFGAIAVQWTAYGATSRV
jgi:hypothetical protein